MPELTIPSADPNKHIHLATQLPIPQHRLIDAREAHGHLLGMKVLVIEHGKISENQDFTRVCQVIASANTAFQKAPDKSIYGMNVHAILSHWRSERLDRLVHQTVGPWSMP